MTDVFTPGKRSEVMSRIRGRNTKPEIAVRSMLHCMGYRFTVNGPLNRTLPRHRTVVFVHGCFWHGHEDCPVFRVVPHRGGFRPGVDYTKLNQLVDELETDEFIRRV